MKADNCIGTVNVQEDASSRSKLISFFERAFEIPAWIGLIIMRINSKDIGKNLSNLTCIMKSFTHKVLVYINCGSCSFKVECISVF